VAFATRGDVADVPSQKFVISAAATGASAGFERTLEAMILVCFWLRSFLAAYPFECTRLRIS
jgi:hypothetical protein